MIIAPRVCVSDSSVSLPTRTHKPTLTDMSPSCMYYFHRLAVPDLEKDRLPNRTISGLSWDTAVLYQTARRSRGLKVALVLSSQ